MKVLRVYLDTSVLGGCFDSEFAPWSNGLMDDFRARTFHPILSELVAREIEPAPDGVKNLYTELAALGAEYATISVSTLQLTAAYERRKVLPSKYRNDMLHIALATIADADVLVSWNFRHIVHLDKIRLFNSVNLELGYKPLVIHTPREVTNYGSD